MTDNLAFNTSTILDICNDTNWYNTSVTSDMDRDANFSSLHWFSALVVISFILLNDFYSKRLMYKKLDLRNVQFLVGVPWRFSCLYEQKATDANGSGTIL